MRRTHERLNILFVSEREVVEKKQEEFRRKRGLKENTIRARVTRVQRAEGKGDGDEEESEEGRGRGGIEKRGKRKRKREKGEEPGRR